ncbi:hypothetical protein FE275_27365 [Pseudomonas koreensis]|jgi:hypothetical protein|uniref:Uncharacterized protein n=1 Tax=Pseudomonas fluorescens TaxID=294 RepID=A0A423MZJ3_PSEFL|nr:MULTISPECIES: hypothetical protein [Pseudomonas]KAA8736982.1 hypothetical protein FE275_27365 [Pseudomonas koreensis]MBB6157242.1 hypothetical protein [Pseudomonas sp. JAI115]MCO7628556.1 hypothetical protein [Pseudomonas fluorescens]NHW99230.1 hypothetical protein [Pseudomonas koreensis]PCM46967.1 hypothetical protein CP335_24680 [Pseudomonas fluorescens]
MTIGIVGGWESKAGVLVRNTGAKKEVKQSLKVQQMLAKVGTNPTALNTAEMDKQGLRKNIKGFDPANVSVKQLSNLSVFLRERGLISDITSFTLLNAGDKFDRFGVTKDPDAKFNALEYFATQLDAIQNNGLNGNAYGKNLIPEYKKAIYVLQNLKTYGEGNAAKPVDQGVKSKA